MRQTTILSTAYLGPIEYYSQLYHGQVVIEQYEHYTKQTYCNRCNILTANGVMPLTIPVVKDDAKTLVRDIRISDHAKWQQLHWRAIESAYNSTPFFEYYADDFIPFFEKKWHFLLDFNLQIQNTVQETLGMEERPVLSEKYEKERVEMYDLRGLIHPKKGIGDANFAAKPYYQVFESKFGFTPNLSIVDLLFNMGNEARIILNESKTNN